jgi:hypothetical protein
LNPLRYTPPPTLGTQPSAAGRPSFHYPSQGTCLAVVLQPAGLPSCVSVPSVPVSDDGAATRRTSAPFCRRRKRAYPTPTCSRGVAQADISLLSRPTCITRCTSVATRNKFNVACRKMPSAKPNTPLRRAASTPPPDQLHSHAHPQIIAFNMLVYIRHGLCR